MELKHMIIGAVIIGLVILLVLPMGATSVEEPKNATIDCGMDMVCFMDASENCTKAKVVTDSSGNKMALEMLGKEGGACRTNMTITEVNLDAPGFSAYPEKSSKSTLAWAGKSMVCDFPMGSPDYDNMTSILDFCEGELKGAIDDTLLMLSDEISMIAEINPACIEQTLWDSSFSSYEVNGIVTHDERNVCKATYSFGTDETGTFAVTHFFDMTGEEVVVDYFGGPTRSGDISEWCTSIGWDFRQPKGTATASAAEIIESKGEEFCHVHFILLPASEYLPGISADAYLDTTTQTAIRIKTTMGNTIERVYGV